MMTWLGPVLISSSLLFACGADKGGGDTTSGESTGAASSATTEGAGSSGDVVTTGEQCPAIGCGECAGGCVAEQSCVDGQVICDCSMCPATTSGGTSSSDSASSEPGSTGEPSTTGGTGETTGGGGPIQCTADPQVFPEFDRSCMNNRDCTIVLHQVDCCGSLVAWGVNNDAGKPFAEAEAVCQEQFPQCDCAPMLTVCDDGKMTGDVGLIEVACVDGSCGTSLP